MAAANISAPAKTTSKHAKQFEFFLKVRKLQLSLMERNMLGWLTKRISKKIRNLPSKEIVSTVDNHPLLVLLNDTSHYSIVLGQHEPRTVEWIKYNIGPGQTVIDIGANIGYMTLLFSDLVTETGRVIAVEPDPRSRRMLNWNLRASSKKNVKVLSNAVHDECGVIRFGLAPSSAWSGISCDQAVQWVNVPAITLDVLAEYHCPDVVDVVKIDVEGTEMAVLHGMVNTIAKYKPTILVEFHGTDDEINNHPAKKWLTDRGYELEYLEYWLVVATKS